MPDSSRKMLNEGKIIVKVQGPQIKSRRTRIYYAESSP
jgi:hypothetical protein